MAEVIPLSNRSAVDQAWNDYTEYARELSGNPDRYADRHFHEEFQRRYMRWAHLFRAQERIG